MKPIPNVNLLEMDSRITKLEEVVAELAAAREDQLSAKAHQWLTQQDQPHEPTILEIIKLERGE